MVEIAFILYLLILFIFPGPVIVGTLGIWTTWFLYEKYNLFSQQPSEGKKILYLNGLTYLVNLGLSLAAGFFLAFSVHVFIFDYIYLFAFNFFFSTLLALRWFDFTQPVYRRMLEKWIPSPASGPGIPVQCLGLRRGTGFGQGLIPLFTDAGFLTLSENGVVFQGLFFRQKFEVGSLRQVEKISREKIKVHPARPWRPFRPEAVLIILKDQVYPFRSGPLRDRLARHLAPPGDAAGPPVPTAPQVDPVFQ